MSELNFVETVYKRLQKWVNGRETKIEFNEDFINEIKASIERLEKRWFTIDDAVAYMKCTEELNPSLDEDVALKRMDKISSKYNT